MVKAIKIGIEVTDIKPLKRALKVLGETDAPHLRGALEIGGRKLRSAGASRATGGIGSAVTFAGVKGKGGAIRAVVQVKHPGSTSMEFGRTKFYRGYTGRAMKATGTKFKSSRGQKARPYMGIKKGDQAIGEVRDDVRRLLGDAIEREWQRIGAGV